VTGEVAWLSGTKGMYGRTTDGGERWSAAQVPGAEALDFRDVKAFGEATAYLLSAGPGDKSRIYKTVDGGKNWKLQFTNPDREGFFDAIAFRDEQHGIALGDPVKGSFQLILTEDGGTSWRRLPSQNLPPALPREGAFAASGTCLVTHGQNHVWFCTGGAEAARIFHSADRGQTWTVTATPIAASTESAGIFSIAFRDSQHGMIVGGDYRKPSESRANAAVTTDGGKTWSLGSGQISYRSAVAWAKDRWIAVGTSGSDFSKDDGRSWSPLDHENYNSVAFTSAGDGWAVGPKGRVAKFVKRAP
jgi:photosystem II stability/assembly factor-like uncharacterized protein